MKIQKMLLCFIVLIIININLCYSSPVLNNSDLAELEYNNTLILQQNEHNETRENLGYLYFIIYIFSISLFCFYLWIRKEEERSFRILTYKWISLMCFVYHFLFLIKIFLGYSSGTKIFNQLLIYYGISISLSVGIIGLILWLIVEKHLENPFYIFEMVLKNKKRNKYKRV